MKRILALILMVTCVFCTGCWGQTEITDLALAVATGVDKESSRGSKSPSPFRWPIPGSGSR